MRTAQDDLGCIGVLGALALLSFGHPIEGVALFLAPSALKLLRRRIRPVESLLTLPAVARAFACEVEVGNGSVALGTDRGAATFLDGWLHFEGFRTAFSLSRDDVHRRRENRLELCQGGDVEFRPDGDVAREFSSALDRCYRVDQAAQGVSILPPVQLHPSGVARSWGEFVYGSAKAVIIAVVLLLFHLPAWLFFFGERAGC